MADDRFDSHSGASARCRGASGKRGAHAQGLGRSRGGLSTKIHASTDALGLPVRLIAGPGQQNDAARGEELINGLQAGAVLADKGYDSDQLRQKIKNQGGQSVIPPRKHRKVPIIYDKDLYKERNAVERFFNKLKHFRRVATRYDKLLINFLGFVKIAAISLWLK